MGSELLSRGVGVAVTRGLRAGGHVGKKDVKLWRRVAASAVQATWGLPQTLIGACACLVLAVGGCPRERYRTALVTHWGLDRGLSLGPFVFVPGQSGHRLVVHEYGHTLQSLMLGPLYLPLVVLPSVVWAGLPALDRRRRKRGRSYYSFYTERWANALTVRVTGEEPER